MLDRRTLLDRLRALPFPATEYWVVAGAAMVLHGFRAETRDVDLGCTPALADELERQGFDVTRTADGSRKIRCAGDVELFERWLEGEIELIDGVPTVSVEGLIAMKRRLGRAKDIADIALIERSREGETQP